MKIAFVGYKPQLKYAQGVTNDEDSELLTFLLQKGLDITPVIWNDVTIDWPAYQLVLLKSPWDYHENIAAFYDWLEMLRKLDIQVLNPVDVIKWNSNKRYLKEIADLGLAVIPSLYLTKGAQVDEQLFHYFNADDLVIKPCVSAGAKNTITLNKQNIAEKASLVKSFLEEEDYLVQPFIKEITGGEWSFVFFNGTYSHCLLKTPRQGDFRVQHYLGGSITYPTADGKHIVQAQQYVDAFAKGTLYARVDGVLIEDDFQLMELELIEPYLFLNADNTLSERYYKALTDLI
ncbi:ATP-grasp domain-containing protein [Gynurincola endophyticus]|uniref:ATP-grasp domain-containing protein n=1 Tax=Gynurincola endophyticus TaxID=2479004 RepID=UPI000F8E2C15|nr:hypothetical protein [Gynurincola endophyticus]